MAEWQFRQFVQLHSKKYPVTGGLVVFKSFSADWATKAKSRVLENGWNHWYRGHSLVETLPLHLVQVSEGKHGFYKDSLILGNMRNMSGDQLHEMIVELDSLGTQ